MSGLLGANNVKITSWSLIKINLEKKKKEKKFFFSKSKRYLIE